MIEELIVATLIIIVLYVVFTDKNSPLHGKLSFLAEGFQGDVNMVPAPVLSYYKSIPSSKFGEGKIVVGMHFTNWCGYCKQMKPVWQEVKASLKMEGNDSVVMFENNEEDIPTQGVDSYPTIIKYQDGKARRYRGRSDYDELRKFILTPFTVTTFGSMIQS
jgi:thiol-disulfide isomerase/thioredoxin